MTLTVSLFDDKIIFIYTILYETKYENTKCSISIGTERMEPEGEDTYGKNQNQIFHG